MLTDVQIPLLISMLIHNKPSVARYNENVDAYGIVTLVAKFMCTPYIDNMKYVRGERVRI